MKTTLAHDIKQAINAALKQFGEYAMTDKGAHEVMEIAPWVEKLREQDSEEVKAILHDVLSHEFGHYFVTAFLGSIDDEETDWTDDIFNDGDIAEHY